MINQRLLFDCDGRQQIQGLQGYDIEIIPSGKAFNFISKDEENQDIYMRIKENCDISFLTEQMIKGLDFYPVPIVWLFAHDSNGNYFGTLKGLGDMEDEEFPVVFINSVTRAYGKITENLKEFFSLANYYPYWRRIIEYEQHGVPYDLKEMEEMEEISGEEKQYFENQKKIGEALNLSKDPNAIQLLIERIHSNPEFVVYESKKEAEKTNEFIVI